jgi:Peptidase A4 family
MASKWFVPVTALVVVAGSAVAVAGAAMASPRLPQTAATGVISPGHPMVTPPAVARPGVAGIRDSQVTSTNWSGFAASGSDGAYRSVSASWTEPAVKCATGKKYSAFWVGLDGFSSQSVEQTGTDSDCSGKTATYSGWYEMYPADPVYFRTKVRPGDHLSASVTFSGTDTYTLVLKDRTRGWSHTITKNEAGLDRSSAEVITEAPSSAKGVLRLADFGTVDFTAAKANGKALRKLHPTKIVMIDASGQAKDSTSAISRTGAFHSTWIRSS